jgi:hypothetical protein
MFTRIRNWRLAWLDRWQQWKLRKSPSRDPISSIDPEEFSCLLRSGRKKDMETLAKKLSDRRRSRV